MIKLFINSSFQSKFHIYLLVYLLFGSFIMIFPNVQLEYFSSIKDLFLQKNYLVIFVLPSFLIFGLYQSRLYYSDFVLRLKNRKEYVYKQMLIMILSTFLFLVELLLICSCFIFLVGATNFEFSNLPICIIQLIRVYLTALVIQFVSYLILSFTKKEWYTIFIVFFFLLISYVMPFNENQFGIADLLLSRHLFFMYLELNYYEFLINIVYYIVILSITYFAYLRQIKKYHFIGRD